MRHGDEARRLGRRPSGSWAANLGATMATRWRCEAAGGGAAAVDQRARGARQ
jgi:hypothetical protein